MSQIPDEWEPSPSHEPHDHKGYSEEKCLRCGWVMGHIPLNCMNDNRPHRFPSQHEEIERLREQLEFAHNILGSETMIWVFHGSDNWHQSNIEHLRDPIHAYWEKYGNAFREARRG